MLPLLLKETYAQILKYNYMDRYLNQIEIILSGKYISLPKEVLSISDMLAYHLGKSIKTDGVVKLVIIFTDEPQVGKCILGIEYIYKPISQWIELSISNDLSTRRKILLSEIYSIINGYIFSGRWNDNGIKQVIQSIYDRNCIFFERYKQVKCGKSDIYKCEVQFTYKSILSLKLSFYNRYGESVKIVSLLDRVPAQSGVRDMLLFYVYKLSYKDDIVNVIWNNNEYYWSYDMRSDVLSFHSKRAECGDPLGQYELGKMLLEGKFITKDIVSAEKWLTASSEQGNISATRLLRALPSYPNDGHAAITRQ